MDSEEDSEPTAAGVGPNLHSAHDSEKLSECGDGKHNPCVNEFAKSMLTVMCFP